MTRPRVQKRRSRTAQSDERWALDVTHIDCGRDGWGHLVAVIDCHDRELIGYELSLRARAQEAERALEQACIARFGTLRPEGPTPVLRSDNGLIFQSRRFRAACRDYRLTQEYITPYTPEQNGLIEPFFRSLKEECVWQHSFQSFKQARRAVLEWIRWYNEARPHQSLSYRSPLQHRRDRPCCVAPPSPANPGARAPAGGSRRPRPQIPPPRGAPRVQGGEAAELREGDPGRAAYRAVHY